MSARERQVVEQASGREIVATRVLDAPRPLVFRAWIDRENIGRWWGPRGFTTTILEMDVRGLTQTLERLAEHVGPAAPIGSRSRS